MAIEGIDGLTVEEINRELERGAKFLIFDYCISIVILTFRRSSSIYFVKAGEWTIGKCLRFTLISLLFGWWGLPWGPIYTIAAIFTNLTGGRDVTDEVIASLNRES